MLSPHESDRFIAKTNVRSIATSDTPGEGIPAPRLSYSSLSLLAVSIYGTVLSGLFLTVAITEPRYGHTVSDHGTFSPSAAALLTAVISKTIEICFVTSFLAFLGQVISRRAAYRQGITLANVSMRTWILYEFPCSVTSFLKPKRLIAFTVSLEASSLTGRLFGLHVSVF
jgi:hypothetical protein